MNNKKLAELLFPEITRTPEDYEKMYPARELAEGAVVSRFAPSPTGFLHFGGLFAAFIGRTAAKSTGGVFYLRIEDTDKKREIENGVSLIVDGLRDFGIDFDEGMISDTEQKGDYGPYIQSARREIYRTFVKDLVKKVLHTPALSARTSSRKSGSSRKKTSVCPVFTENLRYIGTFHSRRQSGALTRVSSM